MTEFEERRLDQIAFAADEAEERYRKRKPGLPPEERQRLKDDMEYTQDQLARFMRGLVK